MYPLAIASIFSLAIIIERVWAIRQIIGKTKELRDKVISFLKRNQWEQALAACRLSPLGAMFEAVIAGAARGQDHPIQWEQRIERRRMDNVQLMRRNVWFLGTVGSLAPFVGLFGTVMGIIDSFRAIAVTGSGGFSVVSAGISEALVATGAGLVIAIYSVFAFNYFTTRIAAVGYQWKVDLEDLKDWVSSQQAQGAANLVSAVRNVHP